MTKWIIYNDQNWRFAAKDGTFLALESFLRPAEGTENELKSLSIFKRTQTLSPRCEAVITDENVKNEILAILNNKEHYREFGWDNYTTESGDHYFEHLYYADEGIPMGEWKAIDIENIKKGLPNE